MKLEALTVGYGGRATLAGVSAAIPSASVTALLGVNGCGKSTLLKTIGGLLPPLAGQVWLEGQSRVPPSQRAKLVGYLPQSRDVPAITAIRLALHGRFPHLAVPRRYREEDWRIARQALEKAGVAELADIEVARLSGGQRQKVYLAMLLAQETPIVLLDEPTTYLDIACQLSTWALCRQLAKEGKTVVLATHDLAQAVRYADQLLVLGGGRLQQAGTPEEILHSGALERAFSVAIAYEGRSVTSIEPKEEVL